MERRTRKEIEEYKAWKKELAAMGYTPEGTVRLCRAAGLPEEDLAQMTAFFTEMEALVESAAAVV